MTQELFAFFCKITRRNSPNNQQNQRNGQWNNAVQIADTAAYTTPPASSTPQTIKPIVRIRSFSAASAEYTKRPNLNTTKTVTITLAINCSPLNQTATAA